MSYDFTEKSESGAQPIDCFFFQAGSVSWSCTSAEEAVSIPDWTDPFEPMAIAAERQEHGAEDSTGGIVITVPRTFPPIADFVVYAPGNRLSLTLIQAHRSSLAEYKTPFRGSVVGVEWEDGQAKLTCQPITHRLDRVIPRLRYQHQCNWPLYSAGCGANAETFAQAATVLSVANEMVSAAEFATHPDGWFDAGFLAWESQQRFIVRHQGQVVNLMSPLRGLETGSSVTAYPGCDHSEAMCGARFDVLVRHLGLARVPSRNPHMRRVF